jgi:hypothetical protein
VTLSPVERALGPLDRVRRALLRATGPWLAPLWRDRGLRVTVLGLGSVAVALALAAWFPLWLLTMGPLVLGVPHLVGDARYGVVRQGLARRGDVLAAVLVPVALATVLGRLDVSMAAFVAMALVARGPWLRRAVVACGGVALAALAWRHAGLVAKVFGHGHHGVALALWVAWAQGLRRGRWLVLAASALGTAALLSGALDGPLLHDLRPPGPGLDAHTLADSLAFVSPWENPIAALRQLACFAFLQAVHYAVWLRLIPEEDRARAAPRPFVSSWRALVTDLGGPFVLGVLALTAAFVLAALVALASSRDAYLRLALGHGALELAVVALAWMERRPLCTRAPA